MAQKTIIQGSPFAAPQIPVQPNVVQNSTVYPNMTAGVSQDTPMVAPSQQTGDDHKPIMGFLYSVSRTEVGEYWPIYLGKNTIGKSEGSDICLKETSVSDSHAVLVVRGMKHQGQSSGLFVFIQDTGSTCGTQVNGDTLDFSPCECHSGDVLTIGANYELYLIIIDPSQVGLSTKPSFQPLTQVADSFTPFTSAVGLTAEGPKGTQLVGASPVPSNNPFDTSSKKTVILK